MALSQSFANKYRVMKKLSYLRHMIPAKVIILLVSALIQRLSEDGGGTGQCSIVQEALALVLIEQV